tara:strand:+ start:115 stop:495 length:381 start_codon:yes stop_codon:yes gene_type:complete
MCFNDWGIYIAVLFGALILPGLETVFYNLKLQYSREALVQATNERSSFLWKDVGYYAAFSFVNILAILFLASNNLGIIIVVFISKIVSETLFICFEKRDQVHLVTKQEEDDLKEIIEKECEKDLNF